MDFFFKSVFSDRQPSDSSADSSPVVSASASASSTTATTTGSGGWGLLRTLASKSESVMETYRRDLEEFGTGLKKETAAVRDVAARAVRDLPVSLEETVSHAFRIVNLKGVDGSSKNELLQQQHPHHHHHHHPSSSRFEIQVRAMQSDESTFLEEPLDPHDFESWCSFFDLSQKEEQKIIQDLRTENPSLEAIYLRLVPHSLHSDTFWRRYFYKLHKLTQLQQARADLVRRRIAKLDQDDQDDDEEDLSWEVEDDDDDRDDDKRKNDYERTREPPSAEARQLKVKETTAANEREVPESETVIKDVRVNDQKVVETSHIIVESSVAQASRRASELEKKAEGSKSKEDDDNNVKLAKPEDAKKISEEGKVAVKTPHCDDVAAAATAATTKPSQPQQQMPKEDDLGWDEIEDLGDIDEVKLTSSGTNADRKSDLPKRLVAPEDDEDLTWDIEDD